MEALEPRRWRTCAGSPSMPEPVAHRRRHERRRGQLHRGRAAGAPGPQRRRPDHAALEPAAPAGAGRRRRDRAAAARSTTSTTRAAWPSRSASPTTWSTSSGEFEEQRGASRSWTSTWPAARPSPARSATTTSSSTASSRWPMPWARARSPPATTRASATTPPPAATSCCARVDASKDQTYFLFGLTQAQLARTLFPLGELTKPRGARAGARDGPGGGRQRATARRSASCPTAITPPSWTPTCARTASPPQPTRGRDRHHRRPRRWASTQGVHHFTVGQRRGLGIAAGEPLYVISTDPRYAARGGGRQRRPAARAASAPAR